MSSKKNKPTTVYATDVGSASFCPHSLELKLSGHCPSVASIESMKRGTEFHNAQNTHAAQRAYEIKNSTTDKRCFVATHLYGSNDFRTQRLRAFRDRHLTPYPAGRLMVNLYYRVSPSLVSLCQKNTWINNLMLACVGFIYSMVKKLSKYE